jgi:hypothetical protein
VERFGTGMAAVIIQPMVTGGTEVTVGVTLEPVFGPLIVFADRSLSPQTALRHGLTGPLLMAA